MIEKALTEIIDRLIQDSGMTETEAFCLVGRLLQEEAYDFVEMMDRQESSDHRILN